MLVVQLSFVPHGEEANHPRPLLSRLLSSLSTVGKWRQDLLSKIIKHRTKGPYSWSLEGKL